MINCAILTPELPRQKQK